MRQYSIDKVELTWALLDFKEGMAQGTTITEARTATSWTVKPTGQGPVVRVYNPDRSGTTTVLVDQESKLHQQLLLIAGLDRQLRNQVFPMVMNDTSSGQVTTYVNAFIMSDPDETRGTESATFSWVFGWENVVRAPNVNDQNLVGA